MRCHKFYYFSIANEAESPALKPQHLSRSCVLYERLFLVVGPGMGDSLAVKVRYGLCSGNHRPMARVFIARCKRKKRRQNPNPMNKMDNPGQIEPHNEGEGKLERGKVYYRILCQ